MNSKAAKIIKRVCSVAPQLSYKKMKKQYELLPSDKRNEFLLEAENLYRDAVANKDSGVIYRPAKNLKRTDMISPEVVKK